MFWIYVYFDGPMMKKISYNDLNNLLRQASRDLDDLDVGDTRTRREPEGVLVVDSGQVMSKWKRGELLEKVEEWREIQDERDGEVGEDSKGDQSGELDSEEVSTIKSIETGLGSDVSGSI